MDTVETNRRRLARRLRTDPENPAAADWARALENLDRARRLGSAARQGPDSGDA